jgi:hypothetical protein
VRDLRQVVGERLRALVVYEAHGTFGDAPGSGDGEGRLRLAPEDLVHTLALIEEFGIEDMSRLARFAPAWEDKGLAVPLILAPGELGRSLDSFPLEYGQIIAHHAVIVGDDPFAGYEVDRRDLRRACETQAKAHLLHLREGYIQAATNAARIAQLLEASVRPLQALLVNIARLHGEEVRTPEALSRFVEERLELSADALRPLLSTGAVHLDTSSATTFFPGYLGAVERLSRLVDEWQV